MSSERDRRRLRDIADNADWIAEYLSGMSIEAFSRDRRTADAIERCLQRMTEAVIQLGEEEAARHGLAVTWTELRNLGNRLRHEYGRIDRRIIYDIASDDVPSLGAAAKAALDR